MRGFFKVSGVKLERMNDRKAKLFAMTCNISRAAVGVLQTAMQFSAFL